MYFIIKISFLRKIFTFINKNLYDFKYFLNNYINILYNFLLFKYKYNY